MSVGIRRGEHLLCRGHQYKQAREQSIRVPEWMQKKMKSTSATSQLPRAAAAGAPLRLCYVVAAGMALPSACCLRVPALLLATPAGCAASASPLAAAAARRHARVGRALWAAAPAGGPPAEPGALPASHLGGGCAGVREPAAEDLPTLQQAADLEVVLLDLARAQRAGRGTAGRAVGPEAEDADAAAQAPANIAGHLVWRHAAPARLHHAVADQPAMR